MDLLDLAPERALRRVRSKAAAGGSPSPAPLIPPSGSPRRPQAGVRCGGYRAVCSPQGDGITGGTFIDALARFRQFAPSGAGEYKNANPSSASASLRALEAPGHGNRALADLSLGVEQAPKRSAVSRNLFGPRSARGFGVSVGAEPALGRFPGDGSGKGNKGSFAPLGAAPDAGLFPLEAGAGSGLPNGSPRRGSRIRNQPPVVYDASLHALVWPRSR